MKPQFKKRLPEAGLKLTRFLILGLAGVLAGLTACEQQAEVKNFEPFALPKSYSVGKKPSALLAHDMNNDGFADLLVTNTDSHNLQYFQSYGNGSFKEPLEMAVGREPMGVAAADFDSDGIPDIAVINYGDNNISLILGQKDGMFRKRGSISLGQLRLPVAIGTGDFNGDRKADLVVTLRFDKLVILLGNGDGSFKLAESYQAASNPASLVVGDFNHDKFDDFAIAFNGVKVNYIRVYLAQGDGTFKPPIKITGGMQATFITKGDVNSDGHLDLLVTNPLSDSLTLFLGDGKGRFESLPDFAAEKTPTAIVVDDFNNDKTPDLAVANKRDGSVSILEGRGDGSFVFPHYNFPVGAGPRAMVGADFNNDGLTDVALLLYEKSILEILMRKIEGVSTIGTHDE